MKSNKRIYLDSASTTYVSGEALQAMMPYFTSEFGNPASLHLYGRDAEKALAKAREQVAKSINADPSEIYFTSGATESNNWMIRGALKNATVKRVLVSSIEHPSIIELTKQLAEDGYKIEYIKVDSEGVILVSDLIAKLAKPAALVSVMTANNEVGTIQFLHTIAKICEERGVMFHTDASQAIGSVYIDVKEMKVDALSMSSHKIYGPKGIGALYLKKGLKLDKLVYGGGQERGMRSGTQNVPAIIGFGVAVELALRDATVNNTRIKQLRDYLIREIEGKIDNVKLNGHRVQRLPNNVNFSFKGIEGESLLMLLDMEGIAVSTGSACSSGSLEKSYVLSAMGVADELAQGSLRMTLSRNTTKQDIDSFISVLVKTVKKLRQMSALR